MYAEDRLPENTECPICYWDKSLEELVKLECCGKFLCIACFDKLYKPSVDVVEIPCPFCRQIIDVIENKPRNFYTRRPIVNFFIYTFTLTFLFISFFVISKQPLD